MLVQMNEAETRRNEQAFIKMASSIGVIEICSSLLAEESQNEMLGSIKTALQRIREVSAELQMILRDNTRIASFKTESHTSF